MITQKQKRFADYVAENGEDEQILALAAKKAGYDVRLDLVHLGKILRRNKEIDGYITARKK